MKSHLCSIEVEVFLGHLRLQTKEPIGKKKIIVDQN